MRSTLYDTDNYLAVVGPLVDDPKLQHAAAEAISQAAVKQLDVGDKVDSAAKALGDFVGSDELGNSCPGSRTRSRTGLSRP